MKVGVLLLLWTVLVSGETILNGAGSGTFSYLITDWIYTYQLLKPVQISFSFTNEYAAREALLNGDVSFAGVDDVTNFSHSNLVYFPMVGEALVPQINLPTLNASSIVLEQKTLADIFSGKITNWRDTAILSSNKDVQDRIPDATIQVVYRSDEDTLTELWTRALSNFSTEWAGTYGVFSKWPPSLTNLSTFSGAHSTLGVSSRVIDIPYSIGYVSQSYLAKEPQITQYCQLVNLKGQVVAPFPANVKAAMETVNLTSDLRADLLNAPHPDAWPIASFIFFLINQESTDCDQSRELFKFFFWIFDYSDLKTVADGFAPLTNDIATRVKARLGQVTCDTLPLARLEPQNNMSRKQFFVLRVIAGLMLAFCLFLNIFHICTYRTPLISLVYSIVFLIGSVLTLSAPFMWLLVPTTTAICLGRLWLTSMGFCIILGTMFSRTWQLREIYKLSKMNTHTMTTLRKNLSLNNSMKKLAMTLSTIFLLNLTLLILWTILDPFSATLVPGLDFQATWHCYSHHTYIWMSVQTFGLFGILMWGLFVIYQTWSFHQKTMLRETRWVLLTLYNVVLNFAAVLPLLSLGGWDDDKEAVGLVVSLEFSFGGIILANLLPKAVSTWRHKPDHASSKSSLHGKASMESSAHGLVKLDISIRSASSQQVTTPHSQIKPPHKTHSATHKKLLNTDEADGKVSSSKEKQDRDSPTLLGMYPRKIKNEDGSPHENGPERRDTVDENEGTEISVSSHVQNTEILMCVRNDSLIMDKSEVSRPESPTNLHRLFDDLENSPLQQGDQKRAHPSEPTILEEEEPVPQEGTPLRTLRRLMHPSGVPEELSPKKTTPISFEIRVEKSASETPSGGSGSGEFNSVSNSPAAPQRSTQRKSSISDGYMDVY